MSKVIYTKNRGLYDADFYRTYNSFLIELQNSEPNLYKELSTSEDLVWGKSQLEKLKKIMELYIQELLDNIDLVKRANTSWTNTYNILGSPTRLYKIREPDYTIYELQGFLDIVDDALENDEQMYISDFSMLNEEDKHLLKFIKNNSEVVKEELYREVNAQNVNELDVRIAKLEQTNFIKVDNKGFALTDKGERVTW